MKGLDMRGPALAAVLVMAAALFALGAGRAAATEYNVGADQEYAGINDVPWEDLAEGDIVLIHWQAEPYREKWVINRQGTAEAPIVVRGVASPNGELPVIDGNGATTRTQTEFDREDYGVIKIGGSSVPPDRVPSYITVENLEIMGGKAPNTFTDWAGKTRPYTEGTAAVYVAAGEHITIRNCVMRDCGDGLAVRHDTKELVVEGNFFARNGTPGAVTANNCYVSAMGVTYQYNRFGRNAPGADGNSISDRSSGCVIRYNWIEYGARQLDLVDATRDSEATISDPRYADTFVYGNVIIEHPEGAIDKHQNQIIHFGGDTGEERGYRTNLYFFNNTVITMRRDRTVLFRCMRNEERVDCRNNIFYSTEGAGTLAMFGGPGTLDFSHNWIRTGWRMAYETVPARFNDDKTSISGMDPYFVNLKAQDYRLTANSPCINAGAALHPKCLPANDLAMQYVLHQKGEPRPSDGKIDIGAFEWTKAAAAARPASTASDVASTASAVGTARKE